MIIYLARLCGYTVIPPGTERAVIDGYCVGLAELYRTVPHTERTVPADARVFPAPKPPAAGLYAATKGVTHDRYVLSSSAGLVRFSDERPGVQEVSLAAWAKWAQRHRAKAVGWVPEVCEMEVEQ